MKMLDLKLKTEELNLSEEDKKQPMAKIVSTVIQNVILTYAQQNRGFDEKERRQYYKIADVLEDAVKNNQQTVELDDEYVGFLRKCIRETKLMPNPLLRQVEELVNDVKLI